MPTRDYKRRARPATIGDIVDIRSGQLTILWLLVEELSKSQSIDRSRFITSLKAAFNDSPDPDGPKTRQMDALVRILEHGPRNPKSPDQDKP